MTVWRVILGLWLLGGVACAPVMAQHGLSDPVQEQQAWWGDAGQGYVVSGCLHGTSGTTSTSLTACRAYGLETTPSRQLRYVQDSLARTISYSGGDGVYWLLARTNKAATPSGWTCVTGAPYCWLKGVTQPARPAGTLLLSRSIVAGNAISNVRGLFATNPHNPARIYGTDPYVGMVCDGVTDDSAALQRAVDLASGRGGTTIELPNKTCAIKNVTIVQQQVITANGDGGGLDPDDFRHGCPSIIGQGVTSTVVTGVSTITSEDWLIKVSCFAFGGAQIEAPPQPSARVTPGGSEIAHLSFVGRQERDKEYHGLIVQGTYARVHHVNFHWINGAAIWIGKDTKLESGFFESIHVRGSGRYMDDCGCSTGSATNNRAAVYIGKPSDTHNNNNIEFVNLQMGFSWYAGIHVDCSVGFSNALHFKHLMLHNHESEDETVNQGRLDSEAGIVWVDGTCSDVTFDTFLLNHPGADNTITASTSGPPVAGFHLSDSQGIGRPSSTRIINGYFQLSNGGQFIRVTKAGIVLLDNLTFRSGGGTADTFGQIVVVPDAFKSGSPLVTTGYLGICHLAGFEQSKIRIAYADADAIRDCRGQTFVTRIPSDADISPGVNGGTWSIASGGTTQVRAHGLACTPQARYINVVDTDEPNNCTEKFITAIDGANFTINCNADPTGDGAAGEWSVHVPQGCGAVLREIGEPDSFVVGVSRRQLFIYGMWYTMTNPGSAGNATDYARVVLNKRRLASITPFASVTNQNSSFVPWTQYSFTVTNTAELKWDFNEAIVVTTEKEGAGNELQDGIVIIIVGTLPAVD